jgi:hypothetical protein
MPPSQARNADYRFAILLTLFCLLPFVAVWAWMNWGTPPSGPYAPLIGRFDDQTTVELLAVSYAGFTTKEFWSPNGVPLKNCNLTHVGSYPDPNTRTLLFRAVRQPTDAGNALKLRARPRPVGTLSGGTSSGQFDPETNDYVAEISSQFVPETGMFSSTVAEVWYASKGEQEVGTLTPDQTKLEVLVDGRLVVASVALEEKNTKVTLTSPHIARFGFEFTVRDATGKTVPLGAGYSYGSGRYTPEFAKTSFSEIEIRARHWDRKIVFGDISYNTGSFTQPKVSDVMVLTDDDF